MRKKNFLAKEKLRKMMEKMKSSGNMSLDVENIR